jgi:hypothetical protein
VHGRGEGGTTRRQLVSRGVALGAAAATGPLTRALGAEAAALTDAQLLMPVLGAELLAVFAYRTTLHSGLMSPYPQHVSARMYAQEHAHVSSFTQALQKLGATPPQPLKTPAEADTVLAAHQIPNRLSHLRSERDCLTILVRVENVLAGVYHSAIGRLNDPHLIELCSQVLAAEAQHASVLNLALRPHDITRAVPSSYVQ